MRPLLAAVALLLALAPSAGAQLTGPSFGSGDVEHVTNVFAHFDSAGARLHDGRFYITTERDLTVYDVSEPESPQALGTFELPYAGEPTFTEEDPDTNGEILLVSNGGHLMVIDVSDPANMAMIGDLDDADQHTWTCVLDCTWAYGSEGLIADLRDPANPKLAGDWRELWPSANTHDLTEVAPGVLLSATQPTIYLFDARTDPARPAVLRSAGTGERFIHQTAWPNGGTDPLMLTAGEAIGPGCSEDVSTELTTWSAQGDTFVRRGSFRMSTGLLVDGASPETTWCTHWFQAHPTFHGGGLVAIAWYEHGTRFLKVAADGSIEEVASFLMPPTQASGAYWITDRVLYVADYLRGLDVLRFDGEIPPPGVPAPATTPPPGSVPGPAPRFANVVSVRCRKRALRVRARDARVKRLTAHRRSRRVASGRRALRVHARRSQRLRITAQLRDGTRVARVVRGCARRAQR